LKYLDKEEEEVEVFETLCFNFCGISEKKLKYLDKDESSLSKYFKFFSEIPQKLKHNVSNTSTSFTPSTLVF
jgi:hypothetical protein